MKREQIYVSESFSAEMDEHFLRYKRGELKVPKELEHKRLTKSLVYLIAIDDYFRKKHNFSNRPFEE